MKSFDFLLTSRTHLGGLVVYACQPIRGGPVKIGHSADVPARIRQLEVHYGRPLALLTTLPGGLEEERAIHRRFAHLRLGQTEQFMPRADLMDFLGRPELALQDLGTITMLQPAKSVANVRSSPEWKEWLNRFADFTRKDLADVIDEAVLRYARAEGFELPPKR